MTTLEIASVGSPNPDYLLGPFTLEAVVEILFRVSEWSCTDTSSIPPQDPTLDELGFFQTTAVTSTPYFSAADLGAGTSAEIAWIEGGTSVPAGEQYSDIYKTPSGFYLRGRCTFTTGNGTTIGNWDADVGGGTPVSVDIILTSGTFPVTMFETGPGVSSPVVQAVGWWPYKDKAGLPAWDTATGLPINGGPGG